MSMKRDRKFFRNILGAGSRKGFTLYEMLVSTAVVGVALVKG